MNIFKKSWDLLSYIPAFFICAFIFLLEVRDKLADKVFAQFGYYRVKNGKVSHSLCEALGGAIQGNRCYIDEDEQWFEVVE